MATIETDILTALANLGWATSGAEIEPLEGGVSSSTTLVRIPGRAPIVVKQALARLDVEQDWFADPTRAIAEGHALQQLNALTPSYVPRPIAVITEPPTAVLPLAPQPSTDWRAILLEQPRSSDIDISATLREIATTWHTASIDALLGSDLDDVSRVTELRVDPFYRGLAVIWPHFEQTITRCVEQLLEERYALVHGDFTPKNVLVHADGIWVIDTEVCHIGNPLLDLGSMTTHMMLKSLRHREQHAETMAAIRDAFMAEAKDSPDLGLHVGVILGVRALGRSPAQYLTEAERITVASMADALLQGASLTDVEAQWLTR